jgi:hypothetical protein
VIDRLTRQGVDIDRRQAELEVAGLHLTEVEHAVDHLQEVFARALDLAQKMDRAPRVSDVLQLFVRGEHPGARALFALAVGVGLLALVEEIRRPALPTQRAAHDHELLDQALRNVDDGVQRCA